jgi:hypothetical protein
LYIENRERWINKIWGSLINVKDFVDEDDEITEVCVGDLLLMSLKIPDLLGVKTGWVSKTDLFFFPLLSWFFSFFPHFGQFQAFSPLKTSSCV